MNYQTAASSPAYREHYDSLAQWKVERGTDWGSSAWAPMTLLLLPPLWPFLLIYLPFAFYRGRQAKKLWKEGRDEGGAGRPRVVPLSPFVGAASDFERRVDAGVRRYDASPYPPKYLRTVENADDFDRLWEGARVA